MKTYVINTLLLLLVSTGLVWAQEETLGGIISPAGGHYQGTDMSLDFHLGEWTILNMENSNGQIGNGFTFSSYEIVSVNEESKINFSFYPNPTTNEIYIDFQSLKPLDYKYRIVDSVGKKCSEGEFADDEVVQKIDLINLVDDLYYLTLYNEDQNLFETLKIIKIH